MVFPPDNVSPERSGLSRAVRVGGLSIREYRIWPGYVFPMHSHCRLGFVFVTDGRFTAEMDGVAFDVEPGRALVLPAQELHCETAGALGATCLLVEPESPGTMKAALSRPRALRMREVQGSIEQARLGVFADPSASVGSFFAGVVSLIKDRYQVANHRMPPWLRSAWSRARHEPQDWTVATLAASACVTPETLCRAFIRHFGTTPSECLQANRLESAARQLCSTIRPISSVAFDTGFADQSHLTNRCMARFGMTPGALRRTAGCPK